MRHTLFEVLQRSTHIFRIVLWQLFRLARRRYRHQPLMGHELLREGFEKIGGSFVKLGQIMSLQVDTLPREYCDALLSLLDRVPTCSSEVIARVFLAEFGRRPEEIYDNFDLEAIGSASIGQVHKAKLKTGEVVAIKVQRPGVRQDFYRDLLLMRAFVRVVFLLKIRSFYFMRDPIRELATWTRDELDYRREASHCDIIWNNAIGSTTERIPKVYWELTSARILTMEFLAGPSVSNYFRMLENGERDKIDELIRLGFDPEIFCGNVIVNFLRDAFRHGVFHADLHPANLLILPNNVVGYVDFGIVAKLTPEARHKQIELTLAYSSGDPEAIYREFLNICMLTPEADLAGMRKHIAEMSQNWYEEPAVHGKVKFRASVTVAMRDLLMVCRNYGVLVDREMIKYIRSTVLVDGVVSRLAPKFDLAKSLRDVVEEYLFEQSRKKILSQGGTLSMLTDMAIWMKSGPSSLVRAMELFERRQMNLKIRSNTESDPERPLRARAFAGTVVWAFTIVFLSLGGGVPAMQSSLLLKSITGLFMASWTIWLLLLFRRITVGK